MDNREHEIPRSYRDVARELNARMRDGRIGIGDFLPREREVQEEFGVARTTVRRAYRFLIEMGKVELIPNRGVRAVGETRRGPRRIAFVDGDTKVLSELFLTLGARFTDRGDDLVHVDSQRMGLENALAYVREKEFSGAFVWSFEGFPDPEAFARTAERMPIVVLDHAIPGFEADTVRFDNVALGEQAVRCLAGRGAKRIAVSGMFDMLDVTHARFSGYLKGLFAIDAIPTPDDFLFSSTSECAPLSPRGLVRRMTDPDRPDGIVLLQDNDLPIVVRTLLDEGVTIPDDVELIVIGNDTQVEIAGRRVPAIRLDWDEFGAHAWSLMNDRLNGHSGPPRLLVARHHLPTFDPSTSAFPTVVATHSKKRLSHAS